MGPLALADHVGHDVTGAIQERLWAARGDTRLVPAPTMRRKVAAGRLGRKTGWGFYRYEGST
jgi:3-hydroxybutyryl-CoA dehydrogenase